MSIQPSSYKPKFEKVIDHAKDELAQLRTGRASAQMLDSVSVSAYGGMMKVNEVASVSVPDPNMIIVSPWDKSLLSAIEKGINVAQLNLNPVIDGDSIRIIVPPLTAERRQEMVKILHQKIESARVMLRSVRTDVKKEIEDQKGDSGISEDDIQSELKELDDVTKQYMTALDTVAATKEKELTTL